MKELKELVDGLSEALDEVRQYFPTCQFNEIDIFVNQPKCECIDVHSVTFMMKDGLGLDYWLCEEHITTIIELRRRRMK